VVVHFRAVPTVEAELRRVFRISEDTLRYVIIRPEDESVLNTPPPESQQRYYQPEPTRAPQIAVEAEPTEAPAVEEEAAPVESTDDEVVTA
jgi:hypothetical protein